MPDPIPVPPPVEAPPPPPPAPVFDTHYARVVLPTPELIAADPARFQPIGNQQVRMVAPNGDIHPMPATSVAQAVGMGWTSLPDDLAVKAAQQEFYRQREEQGAFAEGAKSFVNQLAFGAPEIAAGYQDSDAEKAAKAEVAAAHPYARAIGGIGGLVANVIGTEGLGALARGAGAAGKGIEAASALSKGAETVGALAPEAAAAAHAAGAAQAGEVLSGAAPSLIQRALETSIEGAKAGALYSTPQALTQLAYGDPQSAAESVSWGAGSGMLLNLGAGTIRGALGATLGKAQGAVRDFATNRGILDAAGEAHPEKLAQMADEMDLQHLGISRQDAVKLGPDRIKNMANVVRQDGLRDATYEELAARKEAAGAAIGEHSKILDREIGKLPKDQREGLGVKAWGYAEDPARPDGGALAQKVEKEILETRPGLNTPMYSAERNELGKIVETISSYGREPMPFEKLQELKNVFSDKNANILGKPSGMLTPKESMIRQVHGILKTTQEQAMDQAYNAVGLKGGYVDYLAQKERYSALSDMLKFGPSSVPNWGNPLTEKVVQPGLRGTWIGRGAGVAARAAGAVVGGVAGSAFGPQGAWIGSKIMAPVVDLLVRHTLVDHGLNWSSKALRHLADNPDTMRWFGPALAKGAIDAATKRIAALPTALVTAVAARSGPPDPVKDWLGEKANGLTKPQQYARLVGALVQAKADPVRTQAEVAAMAGMFRHDPRLEAMLAAHQTAKLDYLYSAAPKDPNPPRPFSNAQPWQPSPQAKKAFLDKLEIAHNPGAVIDHVRAGTLTPAHVEALTTLYPSLKQQMVDQVGLIAHDPKYASIGRGVRQGLSLLTGVNVANPRGVVYQPPPPQPQGPPPRRERSTPRPAPPQNMMTATQQLEYKGV